MKHTKSTKLTDDKLGGEMTNLDIQIILQMPYLNLVETAFLMRVTPQTIRKWVSINGRTQRPHNPSFPKPVRRGRLTFRTCDILSYQDGSDSGVTLPSP